MSTKKSTKKDLAPKSILEPEDTKPKIAEFSGDPTPEGDFLCYSSSVPNLEIAEAMKKDLEAWGKETWVEENKETGFFVVKYKK